MVLNLHNVAQSKSQVIRFIVTPLTQLSMPQCMPLDALDEKMRLITIMSEMAIVKHIATEVA
jgi:hypothetical protein